MRQSSAVFLPPQKVLGVWVSESVFLIGGWISNEIIAIPFILNDINVKDRVLTIDSMRVWWKIVEEERHYLLTLKANQKRCIVGFQNE